MGTCSSCMQIGKNVAGPPQMSSLHLQGKNAHKPAGPETEAGSCKIAAVVGEKGEIVPQTEACLCKITTSAGEGKSGINNVVAAREVESCVHRSPFGSFSESTQGQRQGAHLLQPVERAAAEAKDEETTAMVPPMEITEQVGQQLETKEKSPEKVEPEAAAIAAADGSATTIAYKPIQVAVNVAPPSAENFSHAAEEEAIAEKKSPTVDTVLGPSLVAAAATPVLVQAEKEEHVDIFGGAAASKISSAITDPVERFESETIANVDVSETKSVQKLVQDSEKIALQTSEKFTTELASVDVVVDRSVAAATAAKVLEQPEEAKHEKKFEAAAALEISSAVAVPVRRIETEVTSIVAAVVSETTAAQKPIPDLEKVAPKLDDKFNVAVAQQTETEKIIPAVAEEAITEKSPTVDTVGGTSFAAATATPVLEQPKEEEHVETTANVVADVSETKNVQKLVQNSEKIAPQPSEKFTTELVSVGIIVEPSVTATTATQVLEKPKEAQHQEKFEAAVASKVSSAVAVPVQTVASEATITVAADVSETSTAQKPASKPAEKFNIAGAEKPETEELVAPTVASAAGTAVTEKPEAKLEKLGAAAASAAQVSAAVVDPEKPETEKLVTAIVASTGGTAVVKQPEAKLEKFEAAPAAVVYPVPQEEDKTESGAGTIANGV